MQAAFSDPDKLAEQVEQYFRDCELSRTERELKNGSLQVRYSNPPTVAGLAVHLDVSKRTLQRYISGDDSDTELSTVDRDVYKTICRILARARDRIDAFTVGASLSGDVDSKTAAILLGGMGYATKSEDSPTVTVRIVGADAAAVDDWSR